MRWNNGTLELRNFFEEKNDGFRKILYLRELKRCGTRTCPGVSLIDDNQNENNNRNEDENMATACYINVYNSHMDRGSKVTTIPQEHYEVDESEIVVGKPLPKLRATNTVTAYDGAQITLALYGKTYTIKIDEEVEVACSEYHVGGGVYSRDCYCVRLTGTKIIYKGGWQWGDTIRQELEGPIGDGEVFYPNGDHFKGVFHLSYASINGPAYAAEGRYTFADGSYIEHAWIHTSKDKKPEWWGLHGVFRIQCPPSSSELPAAGKPDSIAMFLHGGRRYGFELVLGQNKPWVKEWYAGDSIVRYTGPDDLFQYEVVDYELDENAAEGLTTLRLTLKDGNKTYKVEQRGGDYEVNKYDDQIYKPSTRVTVWLPNGDSLDHYGDDVKDFKPYDGYVEVHRAKTAQCRTEHWEKGKLVDDREWQRDNLFSKKVTLPNPTGIGGEMLANVWADGHISYNYGEWVYDGEVKNDRPDGQGVLVGNDYHGRRRYEGLFTDGQYAEEETFTGKVMLHVKSGHKHWSVYNDGEWKNEEYDIEAKLGTLNIDGFWNYEITKITQDAITISFYDKTYTLTPDNPLDLPISVIEGHEYSDGCVYDGDNYSLELTWKSAIE